MSIDNGNYKIFGGINQFVSTEYMNVELVYANTINSRLFTVNDVVWDLSVNDASQNFIINQLSGNIVVDGEISGNISALGTNSRDVVLRSDKQVWTTYTDLDRIGLLQNKNQNFVDLSQCPGASGYSGAGYVYDGGVEISGNFMIGSDHKSKTSDHNLAVLQGISNETVGTGKYNYLEGENNVALAGSTFAHCEGVGNTVSGHFVFVEGSGNVVHGDYSCASGEKNTVTSLGLSGGGGWNFAEGYNNEITGNTATLCKTGGTGNKIENSTRSYAHGWEGTITGGSNQTLEGYANIITGGVSSSENYVEGSGNVIGVVGSDVKGSWIGGEGNVCDTSYGAVFGRYNNDASNVIFSVGSGSVSTKKDAMIAENTVTSGRDLKFSERVVLQDVSCGWYESIGNGTITSEETRIEAAGGGFVENSYYTIINSNGSLGSADAILKTKDLTCTGNVTAAPHYDDNGKKDYYSGFLKGASDGLTNADKWLVGNKSMDGIAGSFDVSYSYNISRINNAPTALVDISGAGWRSGGKKTIYIETNSERIIVPDTSVCDVVTVMPVDNTGSGTDVYIPAPYYGIGTMYTVQFPPVPSSKISASGGGSGNWNTGMNLNRVVFDTNGGGFFTGDSKTTTDIGYAIHFAYTAANNGILWKTKLEKTT
tara:strand:- start:1477 stop:3435 length:1959 start_codon:yes stop_codon:yes gene_type:complete